MAQDLSGFLNLPPALMQYLLQQNQQQQVNDAAQAASDAYARAYPHDPKSALWARAGAALGNSFGMGLGDVLASKITGKPSLQDSLTALAKQRAEISGSVDPSDPNSYLTAAQQASRAGLYDLAQQLTGQAISLRKVGVQEANSASNAKRADAATESAQAATMRANWYKNWVQAYRAKGPAGSPTAVRKLELAQKISKGEASDQEYKEFSLLSAADPGTLQMLQVWKPNQTTVPDPDTKEGHSIWKGFADFLFGKSSDDKTTAPASPVVPAVPDALAVPMTGAVQRPGQPATPAVPSIDDLIQKYAPAGGQ